MHVMCEPIMHLNVHAFESSGGHFAISRAAYLSSLVRARAFLDDRHTIHHWLPNDVTLCTWLLLQQDKGIY